MEKLAKRLFDLAFALVGAALLLPVFLLAWIGIRLSNPGPGFFAAERAGKGNHPFRMYKFRTMSLRQQSSDSAITGAEDGRIFPFGRLLRALKIDELPQLWNVLRGEMSLVGPRPEDPRIVTAHYSPEHMKTLNVAPGMASPGSIYNYMFAENFLDVDDVERAYTADMLPRKLALELCYAENASFTLDLRIVAQTIWVILRVAVGKRDFGDPDEALKRMKLAIIG